MSNNKQTAVEYLIEKYAIVFGSKINELMKEHIDQAKEMEKEQKNNLPIRIHEGIQNTLVYIEDGIVHVKPNTQTNEQ